MEILMGYYVLPLASIAVAGALGAARGARSGDVKAQVVSLLWVLSLPALVGVPLLIASDPPWRYVGLSLVLGLGGAAFLLGVKLYRRWKPPLLRTVLLGPPLIGSVAGLLAYATGIALCWAGGLFRDSDWGFVLTVYAIPTVGASLLLSTACGLAASYLAGKVRSRHPAKP